MVTFLALCMLILGAGPAVLYLIGKGFRDPLHPLIFLGLASYMVSAHKLLIAPNQAYDFLPQSAYVLYLSAAILSLLGFYAGWRRSASRDRRNARITEVVVHSRPDVLSAAAFLFAIIGTTSFLFLGQQFTVTGYVRDLILLWISAAIIAVQLLSTEKSGAIRAINLVTLGIALVTPISSFLGYGQRGDTIRIALILSIFYLIRKTRPFKPTFIVGLCLVGIVLMTLAETRTIIKEDPSKNRITALMTVIPHLLEDSQKPYTGGEEFIFGGALCKTAYDNGHYEWGKAFTVRLVARFMPKELFPDKWDYFGTSVAKEFEIVHAHTAINVPGGAAVSGAAEGFFQLGWFCPIVWYILGYIHQKLWYRALHARRLEFIGYLTAFNVAMLYAILQDIYTAEMNLIYVIVPLWLVYRVSSKRVHAAEFDARLDEPRMATAT
jgi:hypothetical protein